MISEPHVAYNFDRNEYFLTFEAFNSTATGDYDIHLIRLSSTGVALVSLVYFTNPPLPDRRPSIAYDGPAQTYVLAFESTSMVSTGDVFLGQLDPTFGFSLGNFYSSGTFLNDVPVHDHDVIVVSSSREGEVFLVWETDLFGNATSEGNQTLFSTQALRIRGLTQPQPVASVFFFSDFDRSLNPDVIYIEKHNEFAFYFEGDNGNGTNSTIVGGQVHADSFNIEAAFSISVSDQERNPEVAWNNHSDQIGLLWSKGPFLASPNLPSNQLKRSNNRERREKDTLNSGSFHASVTHPEHNLKIRSKTAVVHQDILIKSLPVSPAPLLQSNIPSPSFLASQNTLRTERQSQNSGQITSLRFDILCFQEAGLTPGEIGAIFVGVFVGICYFCLLIFACIAGFAELRKIRGDDSHVELHDVEEVPQTNEEYEPNELNSHEEYEGHSHEEHESNDSHSN